MFGEPTSSPLLKAVLVVEHMRREVHSFVSFNKSIACVVREKDYTGKMMFVCHAYRCHSHVKVIVDHLGHIVPSRF